MNLVSMGRDYKDRATQMLGNLDSMESQREQVNDNIETQYRAQRNSNIAMGAGAGWMMGAKAGAVGGPAGAVIGGAIGLLATEFL